MFLNVSHALYTQLVQKLNINLTTKEICQLQ